MGGGLSSRVSEVSLEKKSTWRPGGRGGGLSSRVSEVSFEKKEFQRHEQHMQT